MKLRTGLYRMMLLELQIKYLIKMFTSAYGWALTAVGSVITFFAPEKYCFLIVMVAILLDALFGIMVSIKAGKFALSKLARVTLFKFTSYGASLIMVFMLEKLAHDEGFIGVKVAAGWAVACEFWSMSASILILNPDAAFFKIMRRHLKGEIEAKTGQDLSDVLPEVMGK